LAQAAKATFRCCRQEGRTQHIAGSLLLRLPVTQTCSWWRVCLCRVVFERWGTTEDCSCSPRAHSRSRSSCETSDQLAFAATNAIAILGLNLIAGQAGLISLGHGAFYGLGAYTLAVLKRVADEHVGVKTHGLWPSTGALCFRIR
jgi:branched-subunit amino acid transport system permease